jgi:hypothetical protein
LVFPVPLSLFSRDYARRAINLYFILYLSFIYNGVDWVEGDYRGGRLGYIRIRGRGNRGGGKEGGF